MYSNRAIITLIWFFVFFVFIPSSVAKCGEIADSDDMLADELEKDFGERLEVAGRDLSKNFSEYLNDPFAFNHFIDTHLASFWDAKSTTQALLGKKMFKSLKINEQKALIFEVERTWRRYAYEGLQHYSGQTLTIQDVVVNRAGDRGWIQILLRSKLLPKIFFDLLVKRNADGYWRGVDVRFKGITYVSIKKHGFREIAETETISALQSNLSEKNNTFFSQVCSAIISEGRPPC